MNEKQIKLVDHVEVGCKAWMCAILAFAMGLVTIDMFVKFQIEQIALIILLIFAIVTTISMASITATNIGLWLSVEKIWCKILIIATQLTVMIVATVCLSLMIYTIFEGVYILAIIILIAYMTMR